MDDLIVCKTQTEAVRNIDSQNEWHTKSGSNYILIVLLSISVMDLTKYGFSVSKCKDDKKRKADERDSKEKIKTEEEKRSRDHDDEFPGLVYKSETSISDAETKMIYCQLSG